MVRGTAASERAAANTRWQMLFGVILVAAVILSVVVMVSSSLDGMDAGTVRATPTPMATSSIPEVEAAPTPSPTPEPNAESIKILYLNTKDLTPESAWPTMHVGDSPITLNAVVYPMDQTFKVTWSCSDVDGTALKMTLNDDDTISCECVGAISGGVTITCSAGGISQDIKIYCRE